MKKSIKSLITLFLLGYGACALAQTDDVLMASNDPVPQVPANENVRIVAVHPNPASERLMVEFTSGDTGDEVLLRIRNDAGKIILRRNLFTLKGGNMVILPVAAFPAGQYTIQLDEGRHLRSVQWQKM